MPSTAVQVTLATPDDRGLLANFCGTIAADDYPEDPAATELGAAWLQRSLEIYDWLRSDSCWVLLGWLEGELAGMLLAVRISKTDARAGFLFIDKLWILPRRRRQGVGKALVEKVQAMAAELGLAGVRLLTRQDNEAARALYRECGFNEYEPLFCEWRAR